MYDPNNPFAKFNTSPMSLLNVGGFQNPLQPQPIQQNFVNPQAVQQDVQNLEAQDKLKKRQRGALLLGALSDVLKGQDPTAGVLQKRQFFQQQADEERRKKVLANLEKDPRYAEQIKLLKAGLDPRLASPQTGSVERFGVYDSKTKELIGTVLKEDAKTINELEQTGYTVGALRSPTASGKSAVSDPLRTITKGGKVVKNIRDSELTDETIRQINESGQVIQPLGFTEKFESSEDVDFSPIKSKYLATQNIIIKASELSRKFVDEPYSALAVGTAAQFVDGIIQNLDVGSDLLSSAKDTRAYKYIQETSKSLEGKDFTDAIQQASVASGVTASRIRDLAYLFAAARGQEGRGLSDKDYENALKIVTGGIGPAGRSEVLKDVSNSLRDEFYRDINFDIATSENKTYVEKLQGLPELPYYIDPYKQQMTPYSEEEINKALELYP